MTAQKMSEKENKIVMTACMLAMFSKYVYSSKEEILEIARRLSKHEKNNGNVVVNTLTADSMFLAAFEDDEKLVVAIRGTDLASLNDWIVNFKFLPTNLLFANSKQSTVHRGFYNAAITLYKSQLDSPGGNKGDEKLRKSIQNLVDRAATEKKAIYFTGHSLGGAIATLLSVFFDRSLNIATYTFGSPHVGDKRFQKNYIASEQSLFCFVNSNDIVPRIPISYCQAVKSEYYLNRNGKVIKNLGFWRRSWDHLLSRLFMWRFFGGIKDHYITAYTGKLISAVKSQTT